MDITYLGHASFRLKGKNMSIITDPFDPSMVGLKFPKMEADLVTVSHDHQDHNKTELVTVAKRIIDGPGEYELGGVSIIGIQTFHDNEKGATRGKNTVYVIEMDNMRICHLGDLGHTLDDPTLEDIGQIDVLFVPVGGEYTIGPKEAVQIVQDIEPGIIIPMHYQTSGMNPEIFSKLAPVEQFTTQLGAEAQTLPKLVLKDIPSEGEQKVIILTRSV